MIDPVLAIQRSFKRMAVAGVERTIISNSRYTVLEPLFPPHRNPDRVTQWLAQLALSEYALSFAENHIDGQHHRELTSDDLKDVGVGSLGHRKTILSAIEPPDSEAPVATDAPTNRGETERSL